MSNEKRRTKRPELYVDDLDEMMHLMLQQGITGAAADVFHALLEVFKQERSNQQQHQAESVGEIGKAFNHLLDKIQSLEATVSGLEEERDRLLANQEQLGELQRLQTENQQLQAQLEIVQAELADPRKMLERVLSQQATAPTETNSTIPHSPGAAIAPIATPTQTVSTGKAAHRPTPAANPDAPKSRNVEETKEKINHIIDAMISWNSSQDTSSQMLAISIPAIKGIGRAIGATYQTAIQEVMAERREELDELNQHWMLGQRHNATVRGKDDVLRSIARENLGLENWQMVEFV